MPDAGTHLPVTIEQNEVVGFDEEEQLEVLTVSSSGKSGLSSSGISLGGTGVVSLGGATLDCRSVRDVLTSTLDSETGSDSEEVVVEVETGG